MPGTDGESLAGAIRKYPGLANTPLVLLTPLRLAADAERWRRQGFGGLVSKPVKQGELGGCLASILGYGPATRRPSAPAATPRTSPELRARLHLLIVEDNRVNQEVALGMLENLGYRADVVDDGGGALRALAEKDYDLVLMDCQMPGMDGYEATRRIRESNSAVRNRRVPIIATTAHALAGDSEKCLAAGMDGYISKPLRAAALEQVIEEWTGGPRAPMDPAPEAPHDPPDAAPAAFDRDDFLDRLMGNEDLARRIARRFVEETPRQIALLAEAVRHHDAEAVRQVAHSIKGSAGNVGGLEIREIAWRLEQTGTAGDLAAAAVAMPMLSASFERAKPIMDTFCEDL